MLRGSELSILLNILADNLQARGALSHLQPVFGAKCLLDVLGFGGVGGWTPDILNNPLADSRNSRTWQTTYRLTFYVFHTVLKHSPVLSP